MENKYKYSGPINKVEALLRLRKKNKGTKGGSRTSPFLGMAIDLHNEGMGPLAIAKEISKVSGKHMDKQRVVGWFERLEHKPNDDVKEIKRREYKLLDKDFYVKIVTDALALGKSPMEILKEQYSGIVTYSDGTTEDINESDYILSCLLDKADYEYLE